MAARRYTWDDAKDRANRAKHGIGLDQAERLDWSTAVTEVDEREDYGELREVALGFIGVVMYSAVFTMRSDKTHMISLRKASNPEERYYVDQAVHLQNLEMGKGGRDGPPGGGRHDRGRKRRHHRRGKV